VGSAEYQLSESRPLRTIDGKRHFLFQGRPGTRALYAIDLRNAGFADARVGQIELPADSGFRLVDAVIATHPLFPGEARPRERTLPGRDQRTLVLDLRVTAACERGQVSTLDEVRVNYRVLGRSESILLVLTPPPAVRC
jgi:hypothetical protein